MHIIISEFLEQAIKEGKIIRNPAKATKPPKSQKGLRNIPLPPMAIEALKQIKKRQEEFHGGVIQLRKDTFVFTWPDDRLVDNCYLSKHFAKLIKNQGLSMNFHGLRHSYATALLQAGENPKVVQELLGDSTISVVLDTYSHVTPGLKEKAAGKLEGLFENLVQDNKLALKG